MRLNGLFVLLLLLPFQSVADDSEDHPLLERYPGFELMQKRHEQYAQFSFPLAVPADHKSFKELQKLEGELTRLAYEQTGGASALEVMQNYAQAITKAGGSIEYQCTDAECLGDDDYHPLHVFGSQNALIVSHESEKFGLLVTSLQQHGERYWVALIAGQFKDYTRYELVILQQGQMQTGLISVDELLQGIQDQGKIAVYGIYFESGKADLKPESEKTLDAIYTFLSQNAGIHLFVVGHTDYTGSLSHNLSLSKDRATAVVAELVQRGIASQRLRPEGVGPLAPVGSNTEEKGRQLNRRVELVLRKPEN